MPTLAAVIAVLLLAGLAALQVALAAGAPVGHLAWGGTHEVLPTGLRIASAAAVVVYAAAGWIALGAAGIVATPLPTGAPILWAIAGLLAVGSVMNAISRSRSSDS